MSRGFAISFCFIAVMALTLPAKTAEPVSLAVVKDIQMSPRMKSITTQFYGLPRFSDGKKR